MAAPAGESRRLVTRLKFANLRQTATNEDLNTKAARGLGVTRP
jgi:hypothetical protein